MIRGDNLKTNISSQLYRYMMKRNSAIFAKKTFKYSQKLQFDRARDPEIGDSNDQTSKITTAPVNWEYQA